jgi:hypothetical protein
VYIQNMPTFTHSRVLIHTSINTKTCMDTYLHANAHMYTSISIYIHHIHRDLYTHICTCIYTYTYLHTFICNEDTCTQCTNIHVYSCRHVCPHARMCKHIYIHTVLHVCAHRPRKAHVFNSSIC